ncbi:hypothetical protein KY290_014161 [Solanum tuberosum]|uniref:Uncharacterized protein n=1 Tax=Solanum tuberosum TaxID=4113 RepID=A0ABQ7VPJ1_SOLTU|nr:hypothetical protein KY284_015249 [Solanum tuberosum]KAH0717571.1 hypothetical protein KY285_013602 [Solanum tuberosum]KAH0770180.1 hypothetical protein KY290_014161 [Solanum tuberosum]
MLLKCDNEQTTGKMYFKFLDFYTTQPEFHEIVSNEWDQEIEGNPMWRLQQKLKELGQRLS